MIRARRSPNPNHACHSSDVLSPTEKSCQIHQLQKRKTTPSDGGRTWGDDARIRTILESIRSKP